MSDFHHAYSHDRFSAQTRNWYCLVADRCSTAQCVKRVVAQRIHLVMGGSSFSTMYCVTAEPPSLRGGFHERSTESW